MELVYLWVKEYKNIKNQGFNFSPRFNCQFKAEYNKNGNLKNQCKLTIVKDNKYINIFHKKINLTGIVGKNGVGKSSILDLLMNRYLNKNEHFFIYYKNDKLYFSGVTQSPIDVKNSITLNISINKNLHVSCDDNRIEDTKIVYYSNNLNEADHVLPSYKLGDYLAKSINISTSYILDQNKIIETEFKVVNTRPKTGFDKIYRSYRIQQIQMALIAIKNNVKIPFRIPDKIRIKNVDLINLFKKIQIDLKEEELEKLLYILKNTNSSEKIFSNYVKMNLVISFILENKNSPIFKKLLEDILNTKTVSSLDSFYDNAKKKLMAGYNHTYMNRISEFFNNADDLLKEIEKFPTMISNGYEIELNIEDNNFDFLQIYERLIQQAEYFWDFNWRGLSSGEEIFLYQFSRFYFLRENFKEDENFNLKIQEKVVENLIFLIDEGEVNLHPEWQKKYIKYLIKFFNKNFTQNIHIILTSHSPFILSDLPKDNVIFLDMFDDKTKEKYETLDIKNLRDGDCINVSKHIEIEQTFGANIHSLLSHGFFMDKGFMGEFAKTKINDVYKYLVNNNIKKRFTQNEVKYIIDLIGEPILKKQLQVFYDEKFEVDEIDKQIREHEEAIKKLKSKKKKND